MAECINEGLIGPLVVPFTHDTYLQQSRLVYAVDEQAITIISCRYHY
ncbi:type II toxin-antitoxin system YoeB family toxin [Vibrio mediterranei]